MADSTAFSSARSRGGGCVENASLQKPLPTLPRRTGGALSEQCREAAPVVREQQAVDGLIQISAEPTGAGVWKLQVVVSNETPLLADARHDRDQALMRSLAATNVVLTIEQGRFISATDPPAELRAAAAQCRNIGCWPVLVGEPGSADTMLASPIILYDYPQLAPESPGDLFDGLEIDEILTLRILTMTDDEKRQAGATDDRVRQMLGRTESLARQQLGNLHGTMRGMKAVDAGSALTEASHE